jgi:hypothetical protein
MKGSRKLAGRFFRDAAILAIASLLTAQSGTFRSNLAQDATTFGLAGGFKSNQFRIQMTRESGSQAQLNAAQTFSRCSSKVSEVPPRSSTATAVLSR